MEDICENIVNLSFSFVLMHNCQKNHIMSSPGQKRGGCGHVMVSFDGHSFCAICRDKRKGKDPCVENPQTTDKVL